ncbi:hypothetical protein SAMN05444280_1683 [Tangfeifania diversioriginum]|uniref:Restriction endonuclease n=1 Tax=Tangfeifania diversioriginum TaxID=1168035 RepID=A0A1M6PQ62_9BACT|nr:hypothetical protein [Tangfeifania diversioriginum]SHK10119.1 hypothetical protein SAMN05444280_1683 [Tangfeifania diversioriginum]
MNYTRKYYESLLDLFSSIVKIEKDDYENLNHHKSSLKTLISNAIKFDIFPIELNESIESELKSKAKNNFGARQSNLGEFLYNLLGKLLYTFELTDRTTDYSTALELYRTELPFQTVSKWKILKNESKEFSTEFLFFDINRRWTTIDNESDYKDYITELTKRHVKLRYDSKGKKIPKTILTKIQNYFQRKFDESVIYIEENYPSIKTEFMIYDSNIRMYIIDRKGAPGQTTKHTKIYKGLNPKNKCIIYPFFLNFASRFHNLEEIDSLPVGSSESLFEIDNFEKYDSDFDPRLIHFELLYLFLKNCNKIQKKEFLKYLIKCSLATHVFDSERADELILFHNKKCRLFIDNTPNLKRIKEIFKSNEFSYIAFTNRPDSETYNYLKELNVKDIVIDDIARNYINIWNGDIIHHYIKERIPDLNIASKYQNISHELITKLKNCPHGMDGWSEFEDICIKIFKYLFLDNFRNYTQKVQAYTNDNIFRRDLIINNNFNDTTSIWGQAKSDFNCNLIVVDFKNYSEPLEQNEFYLPSKYLNLKTGKFGLVITRKGLGNSAKTLQKRMLNLNDELLIALTEDDLIQMIKEKSLNQDPSYRLENIKFSLYETT